MHRQKLAVGDLLEWLAATAFIAAGYLYVNLAAALLIGGACLVYFAQCYSAPLPRLRLRLPQIKRLSRKSK